MARATVLHPAPTSPKSPTISPWWTVRLTLSTRMRLRSPGSRAVSERTSRAGSLPGSDWVVSWVSDVPIMSATIESRVDRAIGVSLCKAPSRITSTRSAMAKTSGKRCETNTQETPRSRSARMWPNSRCASLSVRAAVGSSRMSNRALRESAFAITTIC